MQILIGKWLQPLKDKMLQWNVMCVNAVLVLVHVNYQLSLYFSMSVAYDVCCFIKVTYCTVTACSVHLFLLPTLSYPALSCPVLPCPALSNPLLFCAILPILYYTMQYLFLSFWVSVSYICNCLQNDNKK